MGRPSHESVTMASAKERHPEVYGEKNEDTRERRRTVPMEVMSMGYSRTGTMTMKAAFETLGYPTWHWVTMSENPPDLVNSEFDCTLPSTIHCSLPIIGYVARSPHRKIRAI